MVGEFDDLPHCHVLDVLIANHQFFRITYESIFENFGEKLGMPEMMFLAIPQPNLDKSLFSGKVPIVIWGNRTF